MNKKHPSLADLIKKINRSAEEERAMVELLSHAVRLAEVQSARLGNPMKFVIHPEDNSNVGH
jgi:hypothetical protein